MTEIKVIPVFLLRGINPTEILHKYLNGNFSGVTLPTQKIKVENIDLRIYKQSTTNPNDETYNVVSKSGVRQRIITLNHQAVEARKNNKPVTGFCRWCRSEITGDNFVGIPIRHEFYQETGKSIFYVNSIHDTFGCAYADLLEMTRHPQSNWQGPYCSSETMLLHWFNMVHPGEKLQRVTPWNFLEDNGGPISRKEYFENTYTYCPLMNIEVHPVKTPYISVKRPQTKINIIN